MNYYVQIKEFDGDAVVETYGPYNNERKADKVDSGININLNHKKFYTVIFSDKNNYLPKESGTCWLGAM